MNIANIIGKYFTFILGRCTIGWGRSINRQIHGFTCHPFNMWKKFQRGRY